MNGHFSVQIGVRSDPRVVVSVARDCCWLSVDTFSQQPVFAVSSLTVHLPGLGAPAAASARKLAAALIAAAEQIESASAPAPVPECCCGGERSEACCTVAW